MYISPALAINVALTGLLSSALPTTHYPQHVASPPLPSPSGKSTDNVGTQLATICSVIAYCRFTLHLTTHKREWRCMEAQAF